MLILPIILKDLGIQNKALQLLLLDAHLHSLEAHVTSGNFGFLAMSQKRK